MRRNDGAGEDTKKQPQFILKVLPGGLVIRPAGELEKCSLCEREIEVFGEEALDARFLIVKLKELAAQGGGKCLACKQFICIECSVKTVYGEGMRRLHCPDCGDFLAGLLRNTDSDDKRGAFLLQPPDGEDRHE